MSAGKKIHLFKKNLSYDMVSNKGITSLFIKRSIVKVAFLLVYVHTCTNIEVILLCFDWPNNDVIVTQYNLTCRLPLGICKSQRSLNCNWLSSVFVRRCKLNTGNLFLKTTWTILFKFCMMHH